MHLKICHIGGYEEKILSGAPNYLMGNLSCNVYMKNRLARLLVHINAHIVPIRMVSLVYLLLHILKLTFITSRLYSLNRNYCLYPSQGSNRMI